MVVRGAPDHTVLVEGNFAHYKDKVSLRGSANIETNPAWSTPVDVEIRGVFGYIWAWANSFDFQLRVNIDGTVVFFSTILQLKGGGFWGYSQPHNKFGVTLYNSVVGDENYGMFYDEQWGLYIHKSLTVQTRWAAGLGDLASWGIFYKELE